MDWLPVCQRVSAAGLACEGWAVVKQVEAWRKSTEQDMQKNMQTNADGGSKRGYTARSAATAQ